MQTSRKAIKPQPVFPAPLSLPLKLLPGFIHNKVLVTTLNRMFSKELEAGELAFLQDRIIHISIKDAGIEYRFTLNDNKLTAADKYCSPDLVLQGTVYNYLLLASRQEDTDTLFFSRRLHMQGDTELGLYVKNFLDGMDMDSHRVPAYLESVLQKSLPVYERLFGKKTP
ncbi:MAG: SCP2 sterol-binding domain-containing protein [Gammaproteobacteria bacterium]|nr:SCP2 sterol-binding domain-containing protein [Gammaproteobacteria bacterium]